jgi:hypothetical protein
LLIKQLFFEIFDRKKSTKIQNLRENNNLNLFVNQAKSSKFYMKKGLEQKNPIFKWKYPNLLYGISEIVTKEAILHSSTKISMLSLPLTAVQGIKNLI